MYDNGYDSIYDYTVYDIAFEFDQEDEFDENSSDVTQIDDSEFI